MTIHSRLMTDRHAQLLDAAAAAFAERGFHATTVTDIAERAGVSQGLLYRYFGGKDDLVVALVERYVADLRRALDTAPSLGAALEALFTPADDAEGRLLAEVLAEAHRNARVAEVLRDADVRVAVALADRLRQAQTAGEVAPRLDADAAASVLLALADGLALRDSLADETPAALGATVDHLLARLLEP